VFISCSEQATNKFRAEISAKKRAKSCTTWILLKTVFMFEFHIIIKCFLFGYKMLQLYGPILVASHYQYHRDVFVFKTKSFKLLGPVAWFLY
jgi:hypothetical protein